MQGEFLIFYLDLLVEYLTYPILPEASSADIWLVLVILLVPGGANLPYLSPPFSDFYRGEMVFLSSLWLRFSPPDSVGSLYYSY